MFDIFNLKKLKRQEKFIEKLKEEISILKGKKKRGLYKKRVLKVTKKSAPLIVLTYDNISKASKVVDSRKHKSWLCNTIIAEEKRTGLTSVVLELGDYVVHSEQVTEGC